MGMTEMELWQITPRSLFNKMHGYRTGQQAAWERMRIQTWLLSLPYYSEETRLDLMSFIPLPWDEGVIKTQKEIIQETAKEIRARSKALWAKVDALKEENKK